MRIGYILLSLLVATSAANGQTMDPNEIPKDAVAYRLSICARPSQDSGLGIPAHAFIALNTVDPAQKRVFHAIGAVKGAQPHALLGHGVMLSPVPDALTTKDYASLMQNCLLLPVSRAEYQTAERLATGQLNQMALSIPKADVYAIYGLTPDDAAALVVKLLQSLPKKRVLISERFTSEPGLAYVRRLIDQNLRRGAAR
jgi:hypothetical protein